MWKGKDLFDIFKTCNIFADIMVAVYNEETLLPFSKTQIIKLLLKTHEQTSDTINPLIEEIKEINRNFIKLEFEIIVVKKVNDA